MIRIIILTSLLSGSLAIAAETVTASPVAETAINATLTRMQDEIISQALFDNVPAAAGPAGQGQLRRAMLHKLLQARINRISTQQELWRQTAVLQQRLNTERKDMLVRLHAQVQPSISMQAARQDI
jgi:hypothetical protein